MARRVVALGACAIGLAFAVPVVAEQPPAFPAALASYTILGPAPVEFLDVPRAVVLGADGRTYRSPLAPARRAASHTQGDPADFALSPDGTFLLAGSAAPSATLERLDLVTGQVTAVPLGQTGATRVVALPDTDTALVVVGDQMGGYRGDGDPGRLLVLDLAGVRAPRELGGVVATSAAMSPDGSVIAVVERGRLVYREAASGNSVDGLATRPAPSVMDEPGLYVDGDAWSPDGARLALLIDGKLHVTRADDRTDSEIQPVGGEFAVHLGWRSTTEIVVQEITLEPIDNASEIVAINLDTGARRVLSTYDPGFTGAAVGRLDLARDLLPDMVISTDRPAPNPIGVGLGVVGLGGVLIIVWHRLPRRSRRQR